MIHILSGIQNTTASLAAEQTRLDVISENIANANTAHGLDGKPYQRQVVVFETALQQKMSENSADQMPALKVARI
jgi:flagellar basal body rod protein FlgC